MNIESATAAFVFALDFERYTRENIFQTLNAFFLIPHAFLWIILISRPPIIGPLFGGGGLFNNIFHENASIIGKIDFKFYIQIPKRQKILIYLIF